MTVTNYYASDVDEKLLLSLLKIRFNQETFNGFGKKSVINVPKFDTVMTFDTETSTVTNGQLQPLKVDREIVIGNNVVTVHDDYEEYSFICAWSIAITNDGENYYSILGRTIDEFKDFFDMVYDCVKKVLIELYNNKMIDCENDNEIKKIKKIIKGIKKGINKSYFKGLNIWVHNFTYDYYFIKDSILDKFTRIFGKRTKIMKADYEEPKQEYTVKRKNGEIVTKTHKGLKHITFRDSLAYYDCKLGDLPSRYFNKTDGWDYDKFRLPSTPLLDLEDEYVRNDTLKLAECIYNTQQEFSDNEIPLTKTSNDRQILRGTSTHMTQDPELMLKQQKTFAKDVNKIASLNKENVEKIIDKNGNETYTFKNFKGIEFYDQCLRTMFAGGITQGNAYHINNVDVDVTSFDVASMYPFIMRTHKFVYRYNKEITNKKVMQNYFNEIRDYKYYFEGKYSEGWFAIVKVEDLEVKQYRGIADLSSDLLKRTKDYLLDKYKDCMSNVSYFDSGFTHGEMVYNGKIRKLKSGYMILNDIDYARLRMNYTFKISQVLCFRVGSYETIPNCLEKLLDALAYDKIKYKELLKRAKLKGDSKEIEENENKLGFSKKCFNGSYGMLVENKVRQKLEEIADILNITTTEARESKEFKRAYSEILYNLYGNEPKLPTTYEMGLQTTAFARLYWVYTSVHFEENDNEVLYGDTDSQKVIGDSYKFIEDWNEYIESTIKNNFPNVVKAWTFENEFHCLGVWENEGKYPLFRQYGAKRYMHTNYYPDNKTVETIYTWYDENDKIICPYEKRYKELSENIKKLIKHKVKSIEVIKTWDKKKKSFDFADLLTDNDVKKIEKKLKVKCKIEEKMSVTFAGINPQVLEYNLYSNYPNSRSRLNKLFDGDDGELKISAEESKKLTHTAVDLYKTRYCGKVYDVKSINVVSPVNSSSFVILKKQCYESNINSLIDQFKRVKQMDSSIVFRYQ